MKVYNFGSGWFYSTQERNRFLELLTQGNVPDVAIFIDGNNDFHFHSGEPEFTAALRKFIDGTDSTHAGAIATILAQFPLKRLTDGIGARLSASRQHHGVTAATSYDDSRKLTEIVNRYLQNKRVIEAVARAYHVREVFVWQPIPKYRHSAKTQLFRPSSSDARTYAYYGYEKMASAIKENPKDYADNFLWLADIQENQENQLYVDDSHYSPAFCRIIADRIGRFLLDRKIIAGSSLPQEQGRGGGHARYNRCATWFGQAAYRRHEPGELLAG